MTEDSVPAPVGRKAKAAWKQHEAVRLAMAGKNYQSIADELGWANKSTAWRSVQKALREVVVEDVNELRALEVSRLDALMSANWDKAMAGDPKAADVVQTINARVRLLGLDKAIAVLTGYRTVVVGGTSEEYIAALKSACGAA